MRKKQSVCGNAFPHFFRLDELELHPSARPRDEVGVGGVVQQSHQELPELQRAPALVRRALAVQARLVLYVACSRQNQHGQLNHGELIHLAVNSGKTDLHLFQAPRRCRRRSVSPLCQTCNL